MRSMWGEKRYATQAEAPRTARRLAIISAALIGLATYFWGQLTERVSPESHCADCGPCGIAGAPNRANAEMPQRDGIELTIPRA